MNASTHRSWAVPVMVFAALAVWVFWLRAPGFGVTLWNVDESIHAAAARTLVEGGVLYRDAVDQRTPLTYYAVAAIFKIAGINNLYAVRVVVAAMIAFVAFSLFQIGRRSPLRSMGGWSALIYAALANFLLYPQDTHAAHTEWFLALFTVAAAWLFLSSADLPGFRRSSLIGALLALAFLSKQPALTELGAPIGTMIYLGALRLASWRHVARAMLGILTGFTVVSAITLGAFVAAGVGHDLLFYTWTYNLRFYGPEVNWHDRLLSAEPLLTALARTYPILLITVIIAGVTLVVRAVQFRRATEELVTRRFDCFLLLWFATSLAGAMSSGRGYDHYFFQCLPPLSLLAAWPLSWATQQARASNPWMMRLLATIALLIVGVTLVWKPLAARRPDVPPPDPALPVAQFIREHSEPSDKIFVWGYNPDIYLYADRAPASRFLYCSFQTGLIPWTNVAPGIDTTYGIVPGAMTTLLSDLRRSRPKFIVDCGVGPHRRFSKYPLANFAPLAAFVAADYVEIEPANFPPRGFRVFMAQDRKPVRRGLPEGTDRHPRPSVNGPVGSSAYFVSAESRDANLVRLAVEMNGHEVVAVRFPPARAIRYQFTLPPSAPKSDAMIAVAEWSDGTRTSSESLTPMNEDLDTSEPAKLAFALPQMAGQTGAVGVRALISPTASISDGRRFFNLHAPSLLRYPLPKGAAYVKGELGIQPGAYASDNPAATDGAVFIVRLVRTDGTSHILLNRWLRPAGEPRDQAVQSFRLPVVDSPAGQFLEFEITPGPDGNKASDWTYWSDLMLEVSP